MSCENESPRYQMQDLDEHHGLSFFRGSFEGLGLWEPLLLSPGPSVSDCFLEIDLAMVPASRCCAVSAPGAHDRTPSFFYSRSDGSTDDSGLGAGAFSIRIHMHGGARGCHGEPACPRIRLRIRPRGESAPNPGLQMRSNPGRLRTNSYGFVAMDSARICSESARILL